MAPRCSPDAHKVCTTWAKLPVSLWGPYSGSSRLCAPVSATLPYPLLDFQGPAQVHSPELTCQGLHSISLAVSHLQ